MNEKRSRAWQWLRRGAAGVLSLILAFSLIQPGLVSAEDTYVCGKEAHAHGDGCYETKTETKTVKVLSCNPPATAAEDGEETAVRWIHTHVAECYDGETLVCALEAAEAHTHGADCYETAEEPQCGQDGVEGHEHTEECCQKLTCEQEEIILHTHEDACYLVTAEDGTETKELVCQQAEVAEHVHGDGCYTGQTEDVEVKTLICTLEEHAHDDSCKAQAGNDGETQPADTGLCSICQGEHADADCNYCLLCKADRSQCVICGECGTHAGDHTSLCTEGLCETCQKNPCECVETCEYCGEELIEGEAHVCQNLCTCEPVDGVHHEECDLHVSTDVEEEDDREFVQPEFFANAAALDRRVMRSTMMSASTWGMRNSDASDTGSGLVTSKTLTENTDGTYTLTMEAYATGNIDTSVTRQGVPLDIIFVLDVSGSMDWCMLCGDNDCNSLHCEEVIGTEARNEAYGLNTSNTYGLQNHNDEYITVAYCSQCGVWAQNTGNHFTSSGAHTGRCYIPFNGTSITIKKNITSGDTREKNKSGDYINTHHRQFYTLCSKDNQRAAVVKKSANTFLNLIYENAKGDDDTYGTADDITHRVAMTTFANSGTFYYKNSSGKQASSTSTGSTGNYAKAMLSVVDETDRGIMENIISGLTMTGSTLTYAALNHAVNIYANNDIPLAGDTNGRNRVVVVLTDGAPKMDGTYFKNGYKAVNHANTLKNTYGATVYTIGIFEGAAVGDPKNPPAHNTNTNDTSQLFYDRCNRFMHALSSNYPNATATGDTCKITLGTVNSMLGENESYYLSAKNSVELSQVFQNIYSSITTGGSSSTLDNEASLKDIVTDYFYIPDDANAVTAYSMTFGGNADGEEQWTRDEDTYTPVTDGRVVTVSGFDYSSNWVGYETKTVNGEVTIKEARGKKMVLEIKVKVNPDFLGGNQVPTNTPMSGVYNDGALVEKFNEPTVDIALKEITPEFIDGKIYLSEEAVVPHISNVGCFSYTDANSTTVNTQTDGINNDFVKILYTITDSMGKTCTYTLVAGQEYEDVDDISEWTVEEGFDITPLLYDDAKYTVSAKIEPIHEGTITEPITKSLEKWIYVYKPEITFKDSEITLGDTADYVNNYVDLKWKHGGTEADADEMGPAPILSYTYSPEAGGFTKETAVRITEVTPTAVEFDGQYNHQVPENQNIYDKVIFYRQKACTYTGCEMNSAENNLLVKAEGENWTNFVVHLKSYDVTIQKQMKDGYTDIHGTYKVNVTITSDKLTEGMEIEYVNAGETTAKKQAVTTAGTVTLTDVVVKVGTPATIKRVPYDATYTIKETSGYGYQDSYSYQVTKNGTLTEVENGEPNVGPGAVGTVTNAKMTTEKTPVVIDVTKNVLNPDKKDHTFSFQLVQVDEDGKILYDENEKPIYEDTVSIEVKGEKKTNTGSFKSLIYETADLAGGVAENGAKVKKFYYRITEIPYEDELVMAMDETEYIVEVTLTAKVHELSAEITGLTQDGNPLDDMNAVSFNNTLLGSLTVKKSVVGAEESGSFKFRLTANAAISGNFYAEVNGKETTFTIKDGVADFWLGHKDEITIYGLPHGLEVEIYEYAGDYYPYYKVDSQRTRSGRTVNTEVSSSGTAVKYTNYADEGLLPQTGQLKWPVLALAVLGAGFLGLGVLTRKRKKNGK